MATLYTQPDTQLLQESSGTLWSCCAGGDEGVVVVDVKCIESVVAIVPHSTSTLGEHWKYRVFVIEKPGLDVASLGGVAEEIHDE